MGRMINTRDMTMSLPDDKVTGWSKIILNMLKKGCVEYKEIKKLVGKLA